MNNQTSRVVIATTAALVSNLLSTESSHSTTPTAWRNTSAPDVTNTTTFRPFPPLVTVKPVVPIKPFVPVSPTPFVPGSIKPFVPGSPTPFVPVSPTPFVPGSITPFVPVSPTPFVPGSIKPFVPVSPTPFVPGSITPFVPVSLKPFVPGSLKPFVPGSVQPFATTQSPRTTTMDERIAIGHEHMLYASMYTFSTITILLLIYMSIFGRRVRLSGWLFHTVNFSFWNIVQLFNFAATTLASPVPDFVSSRGFTGRMKEIQAGTLTMFAAGMIFVFPYNLMCYAFPKSVKSHVLSWMSWIGIIFAINFTAIYMFYNKDVKNIFQPNPIDAYLFYVNSLYMMVFMVYIMGTAVALFVYQCKLAMFITGKMTKQPTDIPILQLTIDLINLFMVIPYASIIWMLTLFPNVMNMGMYAMSIIHINMNILLEFGKFFPVFLLDWVTTLIRYQDQLQLFLPCSQFVLTCVLIPYYREQVVFLLSCGYFYSRTQPNLVLSQKAKSFLNRNKQLAQPDIVKERVQEPEPEPERTPVTSMENH